MDVKENREESRKQFRVLVWVIERKREESFSATRTVFGRVGLEKRPVS